MDLPGLPRGARATTRHTVVGRDASRLRVLDAAYGDMVHAVDSGVGNLTAAIKQRSPTMWNETLLIVLSDNGGIGPGNNFCGSACSGGTESLRGHKLESWDGGTRTMAFIAGGWLEAHLRGTSSATFVYIADW